MDGEGAVVIDAQSKSLSSDLVWEEGLSTQRTSGRSQGIVRVCTSAPDLMEMMQR